MRWMAVKITYLLQLILLAHDLLFCHYSLPSSLIARQQPTNIRLSIRNLLIFQMHLGVCPVDCYYWHKISQNQKKIQCVQYTCAV